MVTGGLPSRLARSPFAAVGWKKRRSYCSGDSWTVIERDSSDMPMVGFSVPISESDMMDECRGGVLSN